VVTAEIKHQWRGQGRIWWWEVDGVEWRWCDGIEYGWAGMTP